ncbi:MAG: alpha/beta hydrolase [Thermoanaerobaculia bacterium]|nr:alpha/beta hydrolase [Thermoanaerobaculia bacterium]
MNTKIIELLVIAALACGPLTAEATPREVSFPAADGVEVFADLYSGDPGAPLLLLFHQAGGDARGEYVRIVPRLVAAGFNVLTVDQRVGGDRFGGVNRTRSALSEGPELSYCDAYPDLVAALDWAEKGEIGSPVFAWGSSYSAALAIRLAAEQGSHLAGVLAFSPASSRMDDCATTLFAQEVKIPVFAARPDREMEIESARTQFEDFEARGFQTVVAIGGEHGASMLDPERAQGPVDPTWTAVLDFLQSAVEEK